MGRKEIDKLEKKIDIGIKIIKIEIKQECWIKVFSYLVRE